MKTWRDGALEVEIQLREQYRAAAEAFRPAIESATSDSFLFAVVRWAGRERNPLPLAEWLRSEKPITAFDREQLAQAVEAADLMPIKARQGRPRASDARQTLYVARLVYRRWLKVNDEQGINDFGQRSLMKDLSIEIAIRLEQSTVEPIAVRDLWDRPASRQN
jgi:hypothetical protein